MHETRELLESLLACEFVSLANFGTAHMALDAAVAHVAALGPGVMPAAQDLAAVLGSRHGAPLAPFGSDAGFGSNGAGELRRCGVALLAGGRSDARAAHGRVVWWPWLLFWACLRLVAAATALVSGGRGGRCSSVVAGGGRRRGAGMVGDAAFDLSWGRCGWVRQQRRR